MTLAHASAPAKRPMTPVPVDREHEFLTRWMKPQSPIVSSWVMHFEATETPFVVRTQDNKVMIYAHRMRQTRAHTMKNRGAVYSAWCCE